MTLKLVHFIWYSSSSSNGSSAWTRCRSAAERAWRAKSARSTAAALANPSRCNRAACAAGVGYASIDGSGDPFRAKCLNIDPTRRTWRRTHVDPKDNTQNTTV